MHRSQFWPQKSLEMHINIKNKIKLYCWKKWKIENYQQWFDNFFGFVLLIFTNKNGRACIKKLIRTSMLHKMVIEIKAEDSILAATVQFLISLLGFGKFQVVKSMYFSILSQLRNHKITIFFCQMTMWV